MTPDQKYMKSSKDSNKKEDNLKLVPFYKDGLFNSMSIGYIPVYFNNTQYNSIFPYNMAMNSNNFMQGIPNIQNIPNINNSNINTTNKSSSSNIDNDANKYPSDVSSDTLYSYNSSGNRVESLPDLQDIISTLNIGFEEDHDNYRGNLDKKINKIYETIENKYSEILTVLNSYKIPLPISKLMIRKIIKISIKYSNKEGE